MCDVRAQRAASCIDVSSPAASRARNAAPSAPPSGTAHTCTGSAVQSASAWIHASTRVPPPVATMRCAGVGRRVDHAARDEARRFERGAPDRCRVVREVEIDELRAPRRSPGTAPARRAGTAPRSEPDPGSPTDAGVPSPAPVAVGRAHAVDPVEEQSARVARAAERGTCPARCAGSSSGRATSTGSGITAQTMSVVPQITSTSPSSSQPATSCSPIASIVPPSSTQPGRPRHLGERRARSGRSSASGRARAPHSASFSSSHFFQSNNGNAVAATVDEITG